MCFFINLQSLSPADVALASRRLHAMFTVRSLQFAVWTLVQTDALRSCCPLSCPNIYANMSSLWLVSTEVFGHFSEHWWASERFLWAIWTISRELTLLSCKLRRIFLTPGNYLSWAVDIYTYHIKAFLLRKLTPEYFKDSEKYGIPVKAADLHKSDFVNKM